MSTLALYTTVYPGVEAFLADWYRSVREQTDQDWQLWIGVDGLDIQAVKNAIGIDPNATWVCAAAGETPAQVRQRAFVRIVDECDGVVLVDSDDVMHVSRVAAARTALTTCDLAACALRLVDSNLADLGLVLGLPPHSRPDDVFPRYNVFGLSNSAFRSNLLRRCLPIPAEAELVDWYLATLAWLLGARLAFDPAVQMDYRQHGANMAPVRAPFSRNQVLQSTSRVRGHFQIVRRVRLAGTQGQRATELERVAQDIDAFYHHVVLYPETLDRYVHALNALQLAPLWWSCVAHPALRRMWTPEGVDRETCQVE